jgi:hypothetical protein
MILKTKKKTTIETVLTTLVLRNTVRAFGKLQCMQKMLRNPQSALVKSDTSTQPIKYHIACHQGLP